MIAVRMLREHLILICAESVFSVKLDHQNRKWQAPRLMSDVLMVKMATLGWLEGGAGRLRFALKSGTAAIAMSAFITGAVCYPLPTKAAVANATDPGTNSAIGLMLEKAQFWYEKGRPEVALDFYTRVLGLQPDNRDALVGASKVQFDQGNEAQARVYLDRLRKLSPNDPFIANFDTLKRRSPEDAQILLEARTLAVQGKKTQALEKYNLLFKGNVIPTDLAADYYPLYVSSLPDESVEADEALTAVKKLADDNPRDVSLQLAAAWSLILTTGGRTEGIERLRALEKVPAMTERAGALWRQALLWEGPSLDAQEQIDAYLKTHPTDAEMEAKRAEFAASLPNIGVRSRWKAGDAIEAKDWKTAETNLNVALNFDKDDAEAMAMLSLVKKLTGHAAESQKLYSDAIRLEPDKKEEFDKMLGLDAERAVQEKFRQVDRLADAGKYDEAETLLRSLLAGQRNPGSYLQLATIQAKAGRTDAAIASLQVVLAADPTNADANSALAEIYMGQKRYNDARPYLARAEDGYQKKNQTKGLAQVHSSQAEIMRVDAIALTDPVKREAGLRRALAVDPSSWWIKLELARTLKDEQRGTEAQTIIDSAYRTASSRGALQTQDGQDAMQVAFIWAQENNDRRRADELVQMVPPGQRTASMAKFMAMVAFKQQVRNIAASDDPMANDKLLQLANAPDPTGERGTEIALAFLHMQDIDSLRDALATSLDATKPPTPSQRISYAGVLLQANQLVAAQDVLDPLAGERMSVVERDALEKTKDAMAVSALDPMLQQKQYREADRMIQARLAVHPDSSTLLAASARIQVAQGNAVGVRANLASALERDPGNLPLRLALVEAEMKLQHYARASELAQDGMKLFPRNPYLVIQAANAARGRGFQSQALDLMVKARALLTQSDDQAYPVQTD